MGKIGMGELLVVLLIILLLFGARKLPELARSLGKSLSEFKKGRDDQSTPPADGKEPPRSDTPDQKA